MMSPDVQAACSRLAAAGIDPTRLRNATRNVSTPEDRAVAYIASLRALRQRDLVVLLNVSSASVSRLVTKLLRTGRLRQQVFLDGAIGRPTTWLLPVDGALPADAHRRAIPLIIHDLVAALQAEPDQAPLGSQDTVSGRNDWVASAREHLLPPPTDTALPTRHATRVPAGPAQVPPDIQDGVKATNDRAPAGSAYLLSLLARPAWPPSQATGVPTAMSPAHGAGPVDPPPLADRVAAPDTPADAVAHTERPDRCVTPASVPLPPRRISLSPLPPWQQPRMRRHAWATTATARIWQRTMAAGAIITRIAEGVLDRLRSSIRLIGRFGRGLGRGIGKLVAWVAEQNRAFDGGIARLLGIVGLLASGGLVIYAVTGYLAALPSAPAAGGTPMPSTVTPAVLLRRARVVQTGSVGLIVRATPAGPRIGKLANGTTVEVIADPMTIADPHHPTWWRIRHGNLVGWVSGRFLTFED